MAPYVDELRRATCTHGGATHPEVAYGRDQAGRALAAQAAAYPHGMNEALAKALAGAIGGGQRSVASADPPDGEEPARGGRLADGAALAGEARAAVMAARLTPAPY
eukprot:5501778-Pleurochrysis_carterae.AAC.1